MKTDDKLLQIEITIATAKGHKRGLRCRPDVSKSPDPVRTPRITRLMALAIKFQDMVDRDEVRDYADLARLGFVSRARITQIMNLLNLAPDIQEELLIPSTFPAEATIRERSLRHINSGRRMEPAANAVEGVTWAIRNELARIGWVIWLFERTVRLAEYRNQAVGQAFIWRTHSI